MSSRLPPWVKGGGRYWNSTWTTSGPPVPALIAVTKRLVMRSPWPTLTTSTWMAGYFAWNRASLVADVRGPCQKVRLVLVDIAASIVDWVILLEVRPSWCWFRALPGRPPGPTSQPWPWPRGRLPVVWLADASGYPLPCGCDAECRSGRGAPGGATVRRVPGPRWSASKRGTEASSDHEVDGDPHGPG